MATICLIEDHMPTTELLERMFRHHGYEVIVCADGSEGLRRGLRQRDEIDLYILDVVLPGMLGTEICTKLRLAGVITPILMLTNISTTAEIVATLDSGADDYLLKPFSLSELRARVGSLLRRTRISAPKLLSAGALQIDLANRDALLAGSQLQLRRREFDLLFYLAQNHDQPLSRSRISEHLWPAETPSDNTIDVYIKQLRKKLGPHKHLIQTVHGVGYKLRTKGELAPAH
jgi:DNA-binding response OmpR family regulator